MKNCLIKKIRHIDGEEIYLWQEIENRYSWTDEKEEATVFCSISSANNYIVDNTIHNATVEELK